MHASKSRRLTQPTNGAQATVSLGPGVYSLYCTVFAVTSLSRQRRRDADLSHLWLLCARADLRSHVLRARQAWLPFRYTIPRVRAFGHLHCAMTGPAPGRLMISVVSSLNPMSRRPRCFALASRTFHAHSLWSASSPRPVASVLSQGGVRRWEKFQPFRSIRLDGSGDSGAATPQRSCRRCALLSSTASQLKWCVS